MREVLKAGFKGNLRNTLITAKKQVGGILNSFIEEPFAGGFIITVLKIPLEGGEAAVSKFRKVFQSKVIAEIGFHNILH